MIHWKVSKENKDMRFMGELDLARCAPVVLGGIGKVKDSTLTDEPKGKRLSKAGRPKERDTH